MAVPISQAWTVATYVLKQKLKGRKRFPLVTMLEPLFRCNLACAGCGKIQYPAHILKQQLTPEECFRAVEESGTPMVSIPGGEPLLHPEIDKIVEGLVARKKYVYMCTNALLLKEKLHLFRPSKYLSFSVHVDGQREHHDFSVCREGGYDAAIEGIKAAVAAGFRVTTNTTLFDGADPNSVRAFFDEMMALGVEGMMVAPGYTYEKAPDQKHFLGRARSRRLFRAILSNRKKAWKFNASPMYMEFLMGRREFSCTPWGMPAYSVFGWQKPCYLLQDGYADTFQELIETTDWSSYGTESGNPKCANCMVHSGYEASGVYYTFGSLRGFLDTAIATLFDKYEDKEALKLLNEPVRPVHSYNPLVQIETKINVVETHAAHNPDELEVAEGRERENLEGWTPDLDSEEDVRLAFEKAFDYRGDVTVTLKDGRKIESYVFDRRSGKTLADSAVRVIPANERAKLTIPYSEIASVAFTGRDTAAGKSFEAWVRKYWEKKAAGEQNIGLHPEKLD